MSGSDRDPELGVYVISVAADLAGVHPQTLRLYERRGLLDPDRTAGGARRYSDHDIDRLRRITALAEAGLNLAGVKAALDLQEETARLRAEIADLNASSGSGLTRPSGRRGRGNSRTGEAP